jgi:hypothetical protein
MKTINSLGMSDPHPGTKPGTRSAIRARFGRFVRMMRQWGARIFTLRRDSAHSADGLLIRRSWVRAPAGSSLYNPRPLPGQSPCDSGCQTGDYVPADLVYASAGALDPAVWRVLS